MNEIAAYLANASYVAALGGPPLADLKYGIIIVPAGEESLLFGPPPNFAVNEEFLDTIDDARRDYDRALRMYDLNRDNAEFVRHRFDDDFASVSADARRDAEFEVTRSQQQEASGESTDEAEMEDGGPSGADEGEKSVPQPPKRGRPKGRSGKSLGVSKQAASSSLKQQGIAKTRRSPRGAAGGVNGTAAMVRRSPRGR